MKVVSGIPELLFREFYNQNHNRSTFSGHFSACVPYIDIVSAPLKVQRSQGFEQVGHFY